jgi:hypothetical protein
MRRWRRSPPGGRRPSSAPLLLLRPPRPTAPGPVWERVPLPRCPPPARVGRACCPLCCAPCTLYSPCPPHPALLGRGALQAYPLPTAYSLELARSVRARSPVRTRLPASPSSRACPLDPVAPRAPLYAARPPRTLARARPLPAAPPLCALCGTRPTTVRPGGLGRERGWDQPHPAREQPADTACWAITGGQLRSGFTHRAALGWW